MDIQVKTIAEFIIYLVIIYGLSILLDLSFDRTLLFCIVFRVIRNEGRNS